MNPTVPTPPLDANSRRLYLRLLGHVRPYWRTFGLALLAMVVLAATEPAIPALLKPTFDGSFVDQDLAKVGLMAVLLVVLFAIRGLSAFLSQVALAWVAGRVVMDLRERMFARLTALPSAFHDAHQPGRLISKITYDATQVTEAATHVITVLVRDSLAILGLLAWMLYLDWQLTLIAMISGPLVVLVVRYFGRRLRDMSRRLQSTMGDLTHVVEEAISGHDVVRSFGAEGYERQRFRDHVNWVRRFQLKFASAAAANAPLAQLITAVALAVILYIAAHKSAAGEVTVGTFVSFFAAMALLFSPLKRLTSVNGPLQRGIAAAESVFRLMDEPPEPDHGTRTLVRATGRVELRSVRFTYPGKAVPALHDVTLAVEPGETVALVGPSGGGKSTLAKLILRFYDPDEGAVLLDGIDVRDLRLASLRRNLALVSQDVVLFDDSVAGNIAYGGTLAQDPAAIEAAARAAHALEFIRALPLGFETRIGARGIRLSGGQRQRLAIARAFLKDAPVLILDEATSNLDTESERHVQAALADLRRGRTTLVIAHRLSSIEDADRIAVIDSGRLVDVGSHRELLGRCPVYAGLYRFKVARHPQGPKAAGAT